MRLLWALFVLFVFWQIRPLRPILRICIWIVILGLALKHYDDIKAEIARVKEVAGIA